MLAGQAQDAAELVHAVLALVDSLGCRQCLLWCKADEVVLRLHQQRPGSLLGYVSLPEGPQGGPSMAPFRLDFPQVGFQALCSRGQLPGTHERLRAHSMHMLHAVALHGPMSACLQSASTGCGLLPGRRIDPACAGLTCGCT